MEQKQKVNAGGAYSVLQFRNGKLIDEWDASNLIVNEGLNYLLDAGLGNGAQSATFYLGLYEDAYTPVATVTAATLGAAATEFISYSEATRQEWVDAGAASQEITNTASMAEITVTADKTINGLFLVSSSVKGGTAGTLFSAAPLTNGARAVLIADVLKLKYTAQAASA